jgi:hypothetical protein
MDIEGGGTKALPGAWRVLAESRPYLLVESHTPDEDKAISNVLTELDFRAYRLGDRRWVAHLDQTHPDPEGVWGTLLVVPAEKQREIQLAIGS